MRALFINCTLKRSPAESNTEALARVLAAELKKKGVDSEFIRAVDFNILPGVSSDEGAGDDWPAIRQKILNCEILILASPTWVGRMSSPAQRVIERMDAFLSEKDDKGKPVVFNQVAGFVATGNEDGAKHVIGEMEAALLELGFSIPGYPWTYWNNGASMGKSYLEMDDPDGKKRARRNAATAAANLVTLAKALQTNPLPSPEE